MWYTRHCRKAGNYVYCFFLLSSVPSSAEEFIINVTESTVIEERKVVLESFFNHIYKSVSISPTFVYMPSIRGLEAVNNGDLDAEAARFELIAREYKNLLKVNVPIATIKTVLFCLTQEICSEASNKSIGVPQGFESAKLFCKMQGWDCLIEKSHVLLAKLLDTGVLTSLLLTANEASQVICKLNAQSIFYVRLTKFDQPTYHWVNKQHIRFVPQLESAIRTFKENAPENNWQLAIGECGKNLSTR